MGKLGGGFDGWTEDTDVVFVTPGMSPQKRLIRSVRYEGAEWRRNLGITAFLVLATVVAIGWVVALLHLSERIAEVKQETAKLEQVTEELASVSDQLDALSGELAAANRESEKQFEEHAARLVRLESISPVEAAHDVARGMR